MTPPAVDFRARARRGGNGDDGQPLVCERFALARAADDIIPQIAVVGRHRRDRLGTVQNGAAAEGDDKVAPVPARACRALHDGLLQRVFHDPVEQDELYARLCKLRLYHVQRPVAFDGRAVGDEQQRLFAGQLLRMKDGELPAAENDVRRIIKVEL